MKNYCCKAHIHSFIICDPCHFGRFLVSFLFFLERIFISLHPNKFCLIWFHFSDGSNSKSGSTSIEKIPEKETIQINGTKNTVGADQSPAKKKSSIESLHLIESSSKQVSCNQMFTKCNLTIIQLEMKIMELFTLLKVAKATSYPAISYLLSNFGLVFKEHIHILFQLHL